MITLTDALARVFPGVKTKAAVTVTLSFEVSRSAPSPSKRASCLPEATAKPSPSAQPVMALWLPAAMLRPSVSRSRQPLPP
jgi:hypothetical protein